MAKVDRCLTQTEIDSPLKGTYHYRSTSPIVCLDSSSNRDAGGQKEVSFSAVYTIIAVGTFQLHRFFLFIFKSNNGKNSLKMAACKIFLRSALELW